MIEIDIPMPSCCDECFVLDDHGDYPYCLISQDQQGYGFNTLIHRMPSCPLKENEPRVLTLDEVEKYVGYFDDIRPQAFEKLPLWTESKDGTNIFSGYRDVANIRELIQTSGLDRNYIAYKHWRYWSSYPTLEQRKEVPWDD